jgi:hypothetical protein
MYCTKNVKTMPRVGKEYWQQTMADNQKSEKTKSSVKKESEEGTRCQKSRS